MSEETKKESLPSRASSKLGKMIGLGCVWLLTLVIAFGLGYIIAVNVWADNGPLNNLRNGYSCTYNGATYDDGDSFDSKDGCNICNCENGSVACTERACVDTTPPEVTNTNPSEPSEPLPTATSQPQPTSTRVSMYDASFLIPAGWVVEEEYNPGAGEASNGADVFTVSGSNVDFTVTLIDGGILDHWCYAGTQSSEQFTAGGKQLGISKCTEEGQFQEALMCFGGQVCARTDYNNQQIYNIWKSIQL